MAARREVEEKVLLAFRAGDWLLMHLDIELDDASDSVERAARGNRDAMI